MNAIFYSITIDADCGDCNKTYEDIRAQVGGGIVVWTCPGCGYERERASNV